MSILDRRIVPITVLALWLLIAWKYRPLFAQLVRVP